MYIPGSARASLAELPKPSSTLKTQNFDLITTVVPPPPSPFDVMSLPFSQHRSRLYSMAGKCVYAPLSRTNFDTNPLRENVFIHIVILLYTPIADIKLSTIDRPHGTYIVIIIIIIILWQYFIAYKPGNLFTFFFFSFLTRYKYYFARNIAVAQWPYTITSQISYCSG